jgi:predicted component of type VI protein secretion system
VNLGRKPSAIEPTDQLVAVKDPEGTVSKTHVRLEHSRGRTWVTDQGSTNGTELLEDDGSVIVLLAGQRTAVDDGVRVRIGNRAFTISVLVDGSQGGNA